MVHSNDPSYGHGDALAAVALEHGWRIAAAESVTAGGIATALAAAPQASEWFAGSVVAYQTEFKKRLLGVTGDSVVTPRCAREMARGLLRITDADLVVTATGVGGPDPEEGRPAGTVFICTGDAIDLSVVAHRFDGSPAEVVAQATEAALDHLAASARILARRDATS